MSKIAVTFKPYRSWFTAIYQKDWFWEYTMREFLETTHLKWKKYIISWVKNDDIFNLYKYLSENYDDEYKFLINVNIQELFEDEELKELENFI